jgi:hypothetical protein
MCWVCSLCLLQAGGGLIPADNFKFFCGAMVWEGSELQQEIDKGAW